MVNNLFTIDGMKICDPEAGMFKNTDGYVVESGGVRGYPLQRMITVELMLHSNDL